MKKRTLLMGTASALAAVALAGGSLAAGRAAGSQPIQAPLTTQNLSVMWKDGGAADSEKNIQLQGENVLPGDVVMLNGSDSYAVTNSGTVPAYVRVTISKYWENNGKKAPDRSAVYLTLMADSSHWLESSPESLFGEQCSGETQVFYYRFPLDSHKSTVELLKTLALDIQAGNEYAGYDICLEGTADSVQFAGAAHNDVNAAGILASWGVKATLDSSGAIVSVEQ